MSWRRTLTRKSQQHFLCIDVPEPLQHHSAGFYGELHVVGKSTAKYNCNLQRPAGGERTRGRVNHWRHARSRGNIASKHDRAQMAEIEDTMAM